MTQAIEQARADVAGFMTRLYQRGLTTTSGGNISFRVGDDTVLVTASATDKGRMTAGDVAVLGMDGANRTPELRPSIETGMHLEILRRHPWVRAVVHAHPPAASAFAVSRRPLDCRLLAESYALIGEPAVAPYALMGTQALADQVAGCIGERTPCVLMENHGVLAVGGTLLEAFDRLEVLENVAKVNIYAAWLGGANGLDAGRREAIDRMMGRG